MTRTLLRRPGFCLDPWKEFEDIEKIFGTNFFNEKRKGYPSVNLWAGEEEATVSAELPGVDRKDIDISVKGRALIIRGTRKAEKEESTAKHLRRERWDGEFERTVELPFDVEADRVHASLKDGVLRITLPRAESSKPRKIALT